MGLRCVMFDLDGTLVDTAPDLLHCLNSALLQHGFAEASQSEVKPFISFGARAMIAASLTEAVDQRTEEALLATMLDCYENHIADHSVFFDGIEDTLNKIEAQGLKWGVVTNKRQRFTTPLMAALRLTGRAACIVSGDTTAFEKPHPEPMLAACRQAGVAPERCVYIGDASHDIAASKNANMKTLAARYGYLKPGDLPETWGADAVIESPLQITDWIGAHLCR
ncbi:HAD family hydrolase [Methylomicrobium lacus]|uniref:HAD family hydrolase n=1 Tax=Methylomicrobium lacus TaxID=136992 RepID=UPI00045EB7C1|nr:HAD-IA family hydrolase [Methylomicrobium lacus]